MRHYLLLSAIACLLIFSNRAVAQTTEQDNYKLTFANTASLQPEFIEGLVMDAHCKKTTIRNIVEVKKKLLKCYY